ncbi:MAG: SH3 domain-containing protein [Saprospiraceae bacterium]|nr:SH3 domain-containing protein [Saprospiraceae bacterium]
MKKQICILFQLMLVAVGIMAQSTPYFPDEMVVSSTSLNLRESPDKNAKKIISIPQGGVVQVIETWNNGEYVQADTTDPESPYAPWFKVRYDGKTGWVFGAYITGTIGIYFEYDQLFENLNLPPVYWYGVYARDSFADELRKVTVKPVESYNEFFGTNITTLKTNQTESSKFLIASVTPLPAGYCGSLGSLDMDGYYMSKSLGPGNQMSIYPGNDLNDTLVKPAYGLAAVGCAALEGTYVTVKDYKLFLFDYSTEPPAQQDLTKWVKPENDAINPSIDILWFGDLDRDDKPDMILRDCPYEVGCRASLFLSSKAKKGEFLRKACEHFWPGD